MLISYRVTEHVRRNFCAEDAQSLFSTIAGLGDEVFGQQDPDRCALAVVLLVQRGVHPRDAIQLAGTDWRDLLVAAGLANEDWRERVAAVLGA